MYYAFAEYTHLHHPSTSAQPNTTVTDDTRGKLSSQPWHPAAFQQYPNIYRIDLSHRPCPPSTPGPPAPTSIFLHLRL